jgi:hypothetical protein
MTWSDIALRVFIDAVLIAAVAGATMLVGVTVSVLVWGVP